MRERILLMLFESWIGWLSCGMHDVLKKPTRTFRRAGMKRPSGHTSMHALEQGSSLKRSISFFFTGIKPAKVKTWHPDWHADPFMDGFNPTTKGDPSKLYLLRQALTKNRISKISKGEGHPFSQDESPARKLLDGQETIRWSHNAVSSEFGRDCTHDGVRSALAMER